MCNFKSGIILKNRVVLAPEGNESHSDLLESLNIEDDYTNASKVFVRAELTPQNGNKAASIEKWIYKVDQDVVPDWYEKDPERYEQEFRDAVKDYMKDKLNNIICGYNWTEVKDENYNLTYYFMDGFITKSTFLPFSFNIFSKAFAWSTVRGNPSNIAPFFASSQFNLSATIGTVISSGTKFPFDIYSFAFFPNSVFSVIFFLNISPVEICGQPVSLLNIPATVPFPVP